MDERDGCKDAIVAFVCMKGMDESLEFTPVLASYCQESYFKPTTQVININFLIVR